MLSAALTLGLSAPLSALARQDEPRPAPASDAGNQAGKPGKPTKPTQDAVQGTEQVAIGTISQIDVKGRTISIQQGQNVAYQYQGKVKPSQGQKSDSAGLLILVVGDQAVIQTLEAKGMPADLGPKGKPTQGQAVTPTQTQTGKPAKPTQGPEPLSPTQGPKIQPVKPTQGPAIKPGAQVQEPGQVEPGQVVSGPVQQSLSGLQVGQTVRVVYQQQGGKPQATQIRVLQAQQADPSPLPPPAPAVAPMP
jgi:hypothetical protein